jgi:four helix bundle protein
MTIRRFEDIEAWQKTRQLTTAIYKSTSTGLFAKEFGLRDQIRRAAVSGMSNIAEGFERDGNKEFIQFLSVAKGSIGEVRSQLYVALDAGFLDQVHFNELFGSAEEASRLIAGFMRYLQQSEMRGRKTSD